MASCCPSMVRARWTWPMDAAAIGVKENSRKWRSQPFPQLASSTPTTWLMGMARASARRRARMSPISGGSRSPASIESICPTFIAAPRNCASWSATRRALAGVSSKSPRRGRLPWASWRAPSASMLPATPVASDPSRANLDQRLPGTAEVRASRLMVLSSDIWSGVRGGGIVERRGGGSGGQDIAPICLVSMLAHCRAFVQLCPGQML